jgi:hypothetical protein
MRSELPITTVTVLMGNETVISGLASNYPVATGHTNHAAAKKKTS